MIRGGLKTSCLFNLSHFYRHFFIIQIGRKFRPILTFIYILQKCSSLDFLSLHIVMLAIFVHTDPTVRVSALSVFEALALVEPSTPEILNILGKESRILDDKGFPQAHSVSSEANEDDEEEAVELEYADLSDYEVEIESEMENGSSRDKGSLSFLLRVCLHYIANEVRSHNLFFIHVDRSLSFGVPRG